MGLRISNRNLSLGKIKTVTTPPAPVVDFIGSPLVVNIGETASFTDLSTNNPTAWYWSIPGATPTTSSLQNPTFQFNSLGSQSVTLSATNLGGTISLTKTNYILVNFPYLLDLYPNAEVAYSVRKLRSGYTGNCLRVRRSSDNTFQDIGFVNNVLDTASLLTFAGVGDAFVDRWYDQSLNGRNLTEGSNFNQPRIVNAGVLATSSGKPAINYYGGDRCSLSFPDPVTFLNNKQYVYAFTVAQILDVTATRHTILNITTPTDTLSRFFIAADSAGANTLFVGGRRLNADILQSSSAGTHGNVANVITGIADYATANAYLYKNGTLVGSKSPFQTVGSIENTNSALFYNRAGQGRGDTSGNISSGFLSELVIYTTDQSANRAGIETRINNFFNAY